MPFYGIFRHAPGDLSFFLSFQSISAWIPERNLKQWFLPLNHYWKNPSNFTYFPFRPRILQPFQDTMPSTGVTRHKYVTKHNNNNREIGWQLLRHYHLMSTETDYCGNPPESCYKLFKDIYLMKTRILST